MPACNHIQRSPKQWVCNVCGHVAKTSAQPGNRECSGPPDPSKRGPGASLAQKAVNFAGSMASVAADGFRRISDEEAAARLAICYDCPEYLPGSHSCNKCGCPLSFKPTLRAVVCPLGKWPEPGTGPQPAATEVP